MNKLEVLDLRNKVLDKLLHYYEGNGFKVISKLANFKKDDKTVLWGEASKHSESLVFRPQLWVENKQIKSKLKKIFPDQIGFMTICRSQSVELLEETGNLDFSSNYIKSFVDQSKSYYYNVEKDTLLDPIVNDHVNFMDKVGLPFFDNLNSIQGINDYLNCSLLNGDRKYFMLKDQQEALKKNFDKREVLSGVISAYLSDNPEIDELLFRYRSLFEGNNYILDDVKKVEEFFNQEA